jgi:hypothetical protein
MGEGLEKGANLAGGMYLKGTIDAEHQRMLQEATAEREARNIALTGTEARKTEAAKGTVVAPGSTLHREGQTDFQAPDTKHPQELLDFWKSEAEKNRAMARASDRKPDKEAKPTFPKLMKAGEDGQTFIDQNTNAVGTIVPPVAGSPAEHNWIFPNKPAVQGKPAGMMWSVGGEVLNDREYNQRFYGDANKVSGRGGNGEAPGAPAAVTGTSKPSLNSVLFPNQSATPARADAAAGRPPVAQATPEAGSGPLADAAKQKLAAANIKLQSYGLRQQRADPQGFVAAQQARDAAQREYDSALAQYQGELGPLGAARFRPR